MASPFFHVTGYASVASITEHGLVPRQGAGTFGHGGYDQHSQGKVFLAGDPDAARGWFSKIGDMLEYNAGDYSEDEEREDIAAARVPVTLRVAGTWRARTHVDPLGDRDVPGSFYVEKVIPPRDLAWWSPKTRSWRPMANWGEVDAVAGIQRWERDGTVVVKGTFDPGGFKPANDGQYGAEWKVVQVAQPRQVRVMWRGDAVGTAREILSILWPDDDQLGTPGWRFAAWESYLIDREGRPDLTFLNLKARQQGYPDGVEIVGLPPVKGWFEQLGVDMARPIHTYRGTVPRDLPDNLGPDYSDSGTVSRFETFRVGPQLSPSGKALPGPKGGRTTIQSLIFRKVAFTRRAAVEWALAHDFRVDKVDSQKNTWRIRQVDPGAFEGIRTITLREGVKATVGIAGEAKASPVKTTSRKVPAKTPPKKKAPVVWKAVMPKRK